MPQKGSLPFGTQLLCLGFAIWQPSRVSLITPLFSSLTICLLFNVGRYPTHRFNREQLANQNQPIQSYTDNGLLDVL